MQIRRVNVTPVEPGLITLTIWGEDIKRNPVFASIPGIPLQRVKLVIKLLTDSEDLSQFKSEMKDI